MPITLTEYCILSCCSLIFVLIYKALYISNAYKILPSDDFFNIFYSTIKGKMIAYYIIDIARASLLMFIFWPMLVFAYIYYGIRQNYIVKANRDFCLIIIPLFMSYCHKYIIQLQLLVDENPECQEIIDGMQKQLDTLKQQYFSALG